MHPIVLVSILSPLIPLSIGYKNRRSLLWFYCVIQLLFELFISLSRRVLHINYFLPGNIYLLGEFVIVCFLFRKNLGISKNFFWTLLLVLSCFFLADTFRKGILQMNSSGAAVFSLTYIIFSLAGLARILQGQQVLFLDKYWFFWLCVAFIIYASGNVLVYLFRLVMIEVDFALFRIVWIYLYCSLNILKNILFAVALSPYVTISIRQAA